MAAKYKSPVALQNEDNCQLIKNFPEEDCLKEILLLQLKSTFVPRQDVKVDSSAIRRDKVVSRQERRRRIVGLKAAESARLAAERQVRTDLQQFIKLGTNTAVKGTQDGGSR